MAKSRTTVASGSQPQQPVTFRLPKTGGDPFFGLTRPFYYQAEKRGWLKLIRLRETGKRRGVTLVPYEAIAGFIRKQSSVESL